MSGSSSGEGETVSVTVDAAGGGQRLDRVLAEALAPRLSRSRIQALIQAGHVTGPGRTIGEAGHRVKPGETYRVEVPAAAPEGPAAEAQALDIVYEDADLIVVDKPAGLVVHPAAGHEDGTLVNALIAHCGESLSGIGGVRRPGIVHRLDKDTSGLLVVAKTDRAHQGLSALFADHGREGSLEREYLALVWGGMERPAGTVGAAIGRHPRQRERMAVVAEAKGRHATTHWRELARLGPKEAPVASLVACRLETGRTHQIRVHMAHIGHPLLGDATYAAGFRTKASLLGMEARAALESLGRQALHAHRLGFEHPATGEPLSFQSPPPDDFANLLNALERQSAG